MNSVANQSSTFLLLVMAGYVAILFLISYFAQRKIHDVEDFVVASRRLSLPLAWATLVATWFGAGTLLTITDEIKDVGLSAAGLDPIGAGVCLIVSGFVIAAPLWNMKILTLSDFFFKIFGPRAEKLSAALLLPTYFGWIAVQFVALANMLQIFSGIDLNWGILIVAAVGTGYTMMGGMWAVTLTDAIQLALLFIGIFILGDYVFSDFGKTWTEGIQTILDKTSVEKKTVIPTEDLQSFFNWMGLFLIGVLGNIPGQDLCLRIFSSKSASVAKQACILGGVIYIVVGFLPMLFGLAADLVLPKEIEESSLLMLAQIYMNDFMLAVFVVTILSAVLSTIDSALLAPATLVAQNLLPLKLKGKVDLLLVNRLAVLAIGILSVAVAFLGENAYSILESAYEIPMVSLLVPLIFGIYRKNTSEFSAIVAMILGMSLWLIHMLLGWEGFLSGIDLPLISIIPKGIVIVLICIATYLFCDRKKCSMN